MREQAGGRWQAEVVPMPDITRLRRARYVACKARSGVVAVLYAPPGGAAARYADARRCGKRGVRVVAA